MNTPSVVRDMQFGVGHVSAPAGTCERPLPMDMYVPCASTARLRTAVVLAHGGANHRGSKENDSFDDSGVPNTSIAEYCRRLAAAGFVAFSVGYRLTTERPPPSPFPIKVDRADFLRARTLELRRKLGLPDASVDELLNGLEASFVDVARHACTCTSTLAGLVSMRRASCSVDSLPARLRHSTRLMRSKPRRLH